MTCLTRPVAVSQTSIVMARAGSVRTRLRSLAHGPVRIQNAWFCHRYQVGRTVGPLVGDASSERLIQEGVDIEVGCGHLVDCDLCMRLS
jgi:hypothetical protein